MKIRLLTMGAILAVLALVVASCGVPKSSSFQPIPLGNVPDALIATTTTSTIPVTTTSVEPVSTTTTMAPVPTTNPTEPVTLFFVAGQQLTSTVQFLPRPVQVQVALPALEAGPHGVVGLRTAIPHNSKLKPDFFSSMPDPADERLAIGQIVETLAGLSGVGLIRFTSGDKPISVPLGSGEQSEPGAPLATEDYDVLTGSSPPPPPSVTTTTTTTPSTTAPTAPPEATSTTSLQG